jgi:hypothetical protein
MDQGYTTREQECSDCIIGGMVTDLNSYFGYNLEFEELFSAQTSSCSKTTYSFTTPGTYTIAPTSTVEPPPIPTLNCRTRHDVILGDSCSTIAQQYSISSWSVIKLNGLDLQCRNLQIGESLCIDVTCPTQVLTSTDTCESVVDSVAGITLNQLAIWNPHLDALCENLHEIPSNVICVG